MNFTFAGSPPCLSIHADAPICVRSPSALTATVLPSRSLPLLTAELFATTRLVVDAFDTYSPAGAMNLNGSPRSCACAIDTTFCSPTSSAPPATAAASAAPLRRFWISTCDAALLEQAELVGVIHLGRGVVAGRADADHRGRVGAPPAGRAERARARRPRRQPDDEASSDHPGRPSIARNWCSISLYCAALGVVMMTYGCLGSQMRALFLTSVRDEISPPPRSAMNCWPSLREQPVDEHVRGVGVRRVLREADRVERHEQRARVRRSRPALPARFS